MVKYHSNAKLHNNELPKEKGSYHSNSRGSDHDNSHTHHQHNATPGHAGQHGMQHEHGAHAGHSVGMFKRKFWFCLVLTLPVLLYSEMLQHWFRFSPTEFYGSKFVPLVMSSLIFFYGGAVFLKGAKQELRARLPGMMSLISLAIITAYLYSVAVQFFIAGSDFYWELATLITIMLFGHWLEMASIAKAENALGAIAKLLPDKAEKIVGEQTATVMVHELVVGDLVLVRPGGSIPVDGQIIKGNTFIDESAISGESKLVEKKVKDSVIAGTTNQDGAITVLVTKTGDDTALAGIMRLVSEAQLSKSKAQIIADRAALYLTATAVAVAMVTFVVWYALKGGGFALERAVTVLIIACPHALGLAIPLVVSIATSLSVKNGLLIRRRLALENARNLDWVLFDKTGTLTLGNHNVTEIWADQGYTESDILRLTASLEQNSEHAIGKSIMQAANDKGIKLESVDSFMALPGVGVKGELEGGVEYLAVGSSYVVEKGLVMSEPIKHFQEQSNKIGRSEVYLLKEGTNIIGVIALEDEIRQESYETIAALKGSGLKTAMVTGDSQAVAAHVALALGMDSFYFEVKPRDKSDVVKTLQGDGLKVAFVGDGINDAPALTAADVGIAIGAGTDVALQSADIILIKNDPRDVLRIVRLSKITYKKMLQNLVWASGYNIVAMPLAAGVLWNYGVVLSPAVGAILMSCSTVVVAINAQMLRRARL